MSTPCRPGARRPIFYSPPPIMSCCAACRDLACPQSIRSPFPARRYSDARTALDACSLTAVWCGGGASAATLRSDRRSAVPTRTGNAEPASHRLERRTEGVAEERIAPSTAAVHRSAMEAAGRGRANGQAGGPDDGRRKAGAGATGKSADRRARGQTPADSAVGADQEPVDRRATGQAADAAGRRRQNVVEHASKPDENPRVCIA